jgi:hypothetical protein
VPGVEVEVSRCPKGAAGPVLAGASLGALQHGRVTLRAVKRARFDSRGGSTAVAKALDDIAGDWCKGAPARRERNAATIQVRSPGFLEVLGRDAPYAQAPQRRFSVRLDGLKVVLPTRERGARGFTR